MNTLIRLLSQNIKIKNQFTALSWQNLYHIIPSRLDALDHKISKNELNVNYSYF